MSYTQSDDELEKHLADEALFLTDACTNYDRGMLAYSKQIATSVRKLVHQTAKSSALLTQLGVREAWRWKDTADEVDPANLLSTYGLVTTTISWAAGADSEPVTVYDPLLDGYPRQQLPRVSAFSKAPVFRKRGTPMRFEYWWNRAVMRDLRNNDFSRSKIILEVSNRDGGAHIDSVLSDPFAELSRGGSMALPATGAGGSLSVSKVSPVPATVRQIGFEVLTTLAHYRADLVQTPSPFP